MSYLILISVVVGGVLLYLLSSSGANTEVFSVNYYGLLGLTGMLALSLTGLVGYQLWRLRIKLRNQVFGAKLTLRLVVFFHTDCGVARHSDLCGVSTVLGQKYRIVV